MRHSQQNTPGLANKYRKMLYFCIYKKMSLFILIYIYVYFKLPNTICHILLYIPGFDSRCLLVPSRRIISTTFRQNQIYHPQICLVFSTQLDSKIELESHGSHLREWLMRICRNVSPNQYLVFSKQDVVFVYGWIFQWTQLSDATVQKGDKFSTFIPQVVTPHIIS